MKKLHTILSTIILAALLLSACAPAATHAPTTATTAAPTVKPTDKPVVTLEWWTVNSEETTEAAQRAMAKEFEKTHPNIKINVTVLPESGFTEKMTTTLGAGSGAPDVAYFWDNNWFPQALDLKPYIEKTKFDIKQYTPSMWSTRALFGDKVVGLPLGIGGNFIMYNKKVFDEMKVAYPDENLTPEGYIELVKKLNDPAKKRWGGDTPRGPYRAIWYNMGAHPFSDDNKKVDGYLNSEASVKAYQWLHDLFSTKAVPTPADLATLGNEGTGPVDLFMAGRLAMATLNQGHMLNAIKAGVPFGIIPEPGYKDKQRYVNAWSLTVSVWKGTKYPDEAWEFLKYWAGPEGQKYLMENSNLLPSIPSVLAQYKNANTDYFKAFMKVMELPQVAEWTRPHVCNSTVLKAAQPVWDKVNLLQIQKADIKSELDKLVPAAQTALEQCVAKLK